MVALRIFVCTHKGFSDTYTLLFLFNNPHVFPSLFAHYTNKYLLIFTNPSTHTPPLEKAFYCFISYCLNEKPFDCYNHKQTKSNSQNVFVITEK